MQKDVTQNDLSHLSDMYSSGKVQFISGDQKKKKKKPSNSKTAKR